jgi:hypothetical protein
MPRTLLLLPLLLLAAPTASAGEAIDHHAAMLGWWHFEQEPGARLRHNAARRTLADDPADDHARTTIDAFEEEAGIRLRVERDRASAVEADGEEETIEYRVLETHDDGLTLRGQEDEDDSPETFRVGFAPAGRMVWSHVDHDDRLHFRRMVDASSFQGTWSLLLGPQELAELEEARRSLKENPDDPLAGMVIEMMEALVFEAGLTITAKEIVAIFAGEEERISYVSELRGGRLQVTTTDSEGNVEVMFVVFENDGSMAWTQESEEDLIRWSRR